MCEEGNCCRTFCKVLLCIVNFIFWLAGMLMLAFGIAVTAAPRKVINILSSIGSDEFDQIKKASDGYFADVVQAVGIFMIVLGGIVTIIAIFGFFGACCESKCMLITYVILLGIIILAEIALIIFGAVFPDKFEKVGKDAFTKFLQTQFKEDFTVNSTKYLITSKGNGEELVWDTVQWSMQCCGVNGPGDYQTTYPNWTKCVGCGPDPSTIQVPLSCCVLKDSSKIPAVILTDIDHPDDCLTNKESPYRNKKSCADAVKDTIVKYGKIAIGIAAGIVGLQLILITLAIILLCLWEERTGKYV